jgi:hypothetical protein
MTCNAPKEAVNPRSSTQARMQAREAAIASTCLWAGSAAGRVTATLTASDNDSLMVEDAEGRLGVATRVERSALVGVGVAWPCERLDGK